MGACASAQRVLADPSGCSRLCLCARGLFGDVPAVSEGRSEQAAEGGRLRLDVRYCCEVEHVADGIQKEAKGRGKATVVWTRILASWRLSGSQAVGASGPCPLHPGTLNPPRHQSAGRKEGKVMLALVSTG